MILRRSLLCLGVLLVFVPTSLRAEGPPEPPPAFVVDQIRDLGISVRARRVLKSDPALAALNLGISIEDGIASVWGPIPSDAVGRRAVVLLESVRGIRAVRSNFYAQTPREQNLLGDLARRLEMPERFEASKPDVDSETLRKIPRVMPPAIVTRGSPASGLAPTAPQVFAPRPVTAPPKEPDPPVIPLRDRIASMRRDDPRFARIPILIYGTRIQVQQNAAADDVIRDLVNRLRRLPGVTEVELKSE